MSASGCWMRRPGTGGSWAVANLDRDDDGTFGMWQHGPRRLWHEAEDAYFRWLAWGSPGAGGFGITVTGRGQVLWLENPANLIAGT